jgi:hypothetical protein
VTGAFPVVFPDKPADHRADANIHAHAYCHEKKKKRKHQTGPREDRRGPRINAGYENGIDQRITELKHESDKHWRADFYRDGNDRAVEHARNFFKFIVDGIFLDEDKLL